MNWMSVISFLLEVVGLTLAGIEIKNPLLANRMEEFVDSLEYKFKHIGSVESETYVFQGLLSASIFIILVFGSWWVLGHYSEVIDEPHYPMWLLLGFGVILSITLFVIVIILLSDFINFLNKFSVNENDSEGKALGTLGFIIGMLGVLIEISQWNIWISFFS